MSRRKPRFVSLNVKIAVMFIVLLAGTLLAASMTLYVQFGTIYRNQILDDQRQVMVQNRNHLNNLINSIDQATMLLYADRTVMSILAREPSDYENNKMKDQINEQLIKYIYIPLNNTLTNYEISFFADPSMPFSATLRSADLTIRGIFNDADVKDSEWYRRTVEADGAMHWFRDDDDRNRMHVSRLIIYNPSYNYQVIEAEERQTLGIVVLNFDTEQIKRQIESTKLTKHTRLLLLDRDGSVLFGNDDGSADGMLQRMKTAGALDEKSQADGEIKYNDKAYMYERHTAANGWQLIALLPRSDIADSLVVVTKMIVTTSVLAIVLAVAVSLYLSNRIARPIRRLAGTMGGIHNPQKMQVSVDPPANDEVGVLYLNFNRLMKRMQELMEDVYLSGIKEKEAELKALQAQINPHFLYNTLDSVNWIALGVGADRISSIVSSLANILRYSIKDPNVGVTVAEELEQVKHYVNVQSLCYDLAFEPEYDVDPAILRVPMPKLTLQPLVENAYQYGIEKAKNAARLRIRGAASGQSVALEIDNSGDGTADAALINAHLEGRASLPQTKGGYGIRNVDGRIRLLYGPRFGLRYDNNGWGGMTAIVTLPLPPQPSDDGDGETTPSPAE
ncbi:sensor histidine kinase [Cohnella sp. GCM10027633]|uniref:sensor histidine kinase n=1 Tax=unclassified Cohnella TaxID=2636738 RepID=UPI003641ADAF